MSTDQELLSFVRQVTPAVDDPMRSALADWLDQHPEYQKTSVQFHPVPEGFTEWFHNIVLPRHWGERLPYAPPQGRWDAGRIATMLHNHLDYWLGKSGFSTIAGQRVFVGESPQSESGARATAAEKHKWLGTPVTYSRASWYGEGRWRFVVWFGMEDCYLPPPIDRVLPLTKHFIRQKMVECNGTIRAGVARRRYEKWMAKHGVEPLSPAGFAEVVPDILPRATVGRSGVLTGVRWVESCR